MNDITKIESIIIYTDIALKTQPKILIKLQKLSQKDNFLYIVKSYT